MMMSRDVTNGLTELRQGGTEGDGSKTPPLMTETEAHNIKPFTGTGEEQTEGGGSWEQTMMASSSMSSYSFSVFEDLKADKRIRDEEGSKESEEAGVTSSVESAESEGSMSSFDVLSSNVEDDDTDEDDDEDVKSLGELSDSRSGSSSFACIGAEALTRPCPISTLSRDTQRTDAVESSPIDLPVSVRSFSRSVNVFPFGIARETIPETTGVNGAEGVTLQKQGTGNGSEHGHLRDDEEILACDQNLSDQERESKLTENPKIQMCSFPEHRQLSGEAKDMEGERFVKTQKNTQKMESDTQIRDEDGDTWMEVENGASFTDLGDIKMYMTEEEASANFIAPRLPSLPASHHDAPVEEKVQQLQRLVDELRYETEGKLTRLREKSENLEALLYSIVPSVFRLSPPIFLSSYETSVSFPFRRSTAATAGIPAAKAEKKQNLLTNSIESRSVYEVQMPSFLSSASSMVLTQSSCSCGGAGKEMLEKSEFLSNLEAAEKYREAAEGHIEKHKAAEQLSFTNAPFCGECSCSWDQAVKLPSSPSSFSQKNNLRTVNTIGTGASERTTKKLGLNDTDGCGSSSVSSEVFDADSNTPRCDSGPPWGESAEWRGGFPKAERATLFGSAFSCAGLQADQHRASLCEAERGARKSVMAFLQGNSGHAGVRTLESASVCPPPAPWVTKLREVGARLFFEATNERRESQAMLNEDGDVTGAEENGSARETPQKSGKEPASHGVERKLCTARHVVHIDDEGEGYAHVEGEEGEVRASERYGGGFAALHSERRAEHLYELDAKKEMVPNTCKAKSLFTGHRFVNRRYDRGARGGEEHAELTEEEDEQEGENSADEDPFSCSFTAAASSPPLPSPRVASLVADFLPFLNPLSYPVRFLARVLGLNVDGSFDRWRVEIQRGSVRGTVVLGVLDATVCVGLVMGLVYLSFFVSRMVFKTMYVHVHAIEEEKVPHYFEGLTYKFWGKKPIYFSDVPAERESGWIAQRVNWYRPHGY